MENIVSNIKNDKNMCVKNGNKSSLLWYKGKNYIKAWLNMNDIKACLKHVTASIMWYNGLQVSEDALKGAL